MTTERDDTMFVDECDRALDEMERALDDVRLALVEATIDERATTREEDDAREFERARRRRPERSSTRSRRVCVERGERCWTRVRESSLGVGGKAAMVTRCGRVETRARTRGGTRREGRRYLAGDSEGDVGDDERGDEGGERDGVDSIGARGLGLGASAASARRRRRRARRVLPRTARARGEQRGGDARKEREGSRVRERARRGIARGESRDVVRGRRRVWRARRQATETPTTARETREDDGAVEDEPSSSTRDALSGARTTVATTTAAASRARPPPAAAAAETRAADSTPCAVPIVSTPPRTSSRSAPTFSIARRTSVRPFWRRSPRSGESLTRSGAAAREGVAKMDRNLKVVKGMNSWTRLGC